MPLFLLHLIGDAFIGEGGKLSGEEFHLKEQQVFTIHLVCSNIVQSWISTYILICLNFVLFQNSYDGKVHHYRIWQSESGDFYIDDNVLFQSLEEMIEFYKKSKGGINSLIL